MKAAVKIKRTYLHGSPKGHSILTFEVEVDGEHNKDLTHEEVAVNLALRHLVQHTVISVGECIEVMSVQLL